MGRYLECDTKCYRGRLIRYPISAFHSFPCLTYNSGLYSASIHQYRYVSCYNTKLLSLWLVISYCPNPLNVLSTRQATAQDIPSHKKIVTSWHIKKGLSRSCSFINGILSVWLIPALVSPPNCQLNTTTNIYLVGRASIHTQAAQQKSTKLLLCFYYGLIN